MECNDKVKYLDKNWVVTDVMNGGKCNISNEKSGVLCVDIKDIEESEFKKK